MVVDPRLPFATLTTSRSAPKVYASKFISTYQILLPPDCSCCRDRVNRAAGRRAGASFFARRLDYFIMTPNVRPLIGTLQKRMPTLIRTAPNQTAGPLGGIARETRQAAT